jgi:type I restriction enzyme R subunit
MSEIQSEAALEALLIKTLSKIGYEPVQLLTYEQLVANFRNQIFIHNKERLGGKALSDSEFKQLTNKIEGKSVFQSAKELRQLQSIIRDNGKQAYIQLLNTRDWCKNQFQVTNQITVFGKRENRYDVTILINGLPLVQVELKRRGNELKHAFNQVNRYKIESYKELFQFVQLFIVSNGVDTKYASNGDRQLNYDYAFLDTASSISCDSFGTSFNENEKATALESVASI